jgi:hypothetical protein
VPPFLQGKEQLCGEPPSSSGEPLNVLFPPPARRCVIPGMRTLASPERLGGTLKFAPLSLSSRSSEILQITGRLYSGAQNGL